MIDVDAEARADQHSDGTDAAAQAYPRRNPLIVGILAVACLLIVAMWVYAFGFASKEAVNKVNDRAWAERAEGICAAARADLVAMANAEFIGNPTPAQMQERAQLVLASTDILERMLDEVVSVMPSDEKGQGIVPLWEADYRAYITDRREYAVDLTSGNNAPFSETQIDGLPISEKLSTFAADNEMDSCGPLHDLST